MTDEVVSTGIEHIGDSAQQEQPAYTQSQVNNIVKGKTAGAVEKLKRDLEAQHAREIEALRSNSSAQVPYDMDSVTAKVKADIYAELESYQAQEAEKKRETEIKEMTHRYFSNLQKGKAEYDDFDAVMETFPHADFAHVAELAADDPETAGIMYHFAQNPLKLAQVQALAAQSKSMAKKAIQGISKSIADNKTAKAGVVKTSEPINRLKSSNITGKTGEQTVQDLRAYYATKSWGK